VLDVRVSSCLIYPSLAFLYAARESYVLPLFPVMPKTPDQKAAFTPNVMIFHIGLSLYSALPTCNSSFKLSQQPVIARSTERSCRKRHPRYTRATHGYSFAPSLPEAPYPYYRKSPSAHLGEGTRRPIQSKSYSRTSWLPSTPCFLFATSLTTFEDLKINFSDFDILMMDGKTD
jgi:hypothetical protein